MLLATHGPRAELVNFSKSSGKQNRVSVQVVGRHWGWGFLDWGWGFLDWGWGFWNRVNDFSD
jgi:hypothetical protein